METDRQRMDFPRAGKKGHKITQERYVHWFTDKPSDGAVGGGHLRHRTEQGKLAMMVSVFLALAVSAYSPAISSPAIPRLSMT